SYLLMYLERDADNPLPLNYGRQTVLMELQGNENRQVRLIGFSAGFAVFLMLAWRLAGAGHATGGAPNSSLFAPALLLLAVVVLVWHERTRSAADHKVREENARFIPAAEKGP